MSARKLLVVGLLVTVILAGVVSYYASGSPDGLNRVAADHGIAKAEKEPATANSPLAGYSTRGVDDPRLSGGLAGVLGVGLVLVLAGGITFTLRRRGNT